MTFDTPLSLSELLDDMYEIDLFYRRRKYAYQEIELQPITLERLTYVALTDDEILTKATELATKMVLQKQTEYEQDCTFQINILNAKNSALFEDLNYKLTNIDDKYELIKTKYQADAVKRGFVNTSAYINGTAEIDEKKSSETVMLNAEYNLKKAYNDGEITAYNTKLTNASSRFTYEKEYQIKKFYDEIKKSEYEKTLETQKYNNSQSEKEQKYTNSLNSNKMSLRLNYLKIVETTLTEDELILCGYYKDMITVADLYFYSINAVTAYDEFSENSIFIYYLGSFYSQINQKYVNRKNNSN